MLQFQVSLPVGVTPRIIVAQPEIHVYPNPSSGSVTCSWKNGKSEFVSLEVVNLLGQVMAKYSLLGGQHEMKISIETPGVYYVVMKDEMQASVTKKVVITR